MFWGFFSCADSVLKSFPETQWHCSKVEKKIPSLWKETPPFCHLSSSDFSWPEAFKIIYLIKPFGAALSWRMFAFEASLLVVYREPKLADDTQREILLVPSKVSSVKRATSSFGHMTWALRGTTVTTSLLPYAPTIWVDPERRMWHSTFFHWGFLTGTMHLL